MPLPRVDGEPVDDAALIEWVATLLAALFPVPEPASEPAA